MIFSMIFGRIFSPFDTNMHAGHLYTLLGLMGIFLFLENFWNRETMHNTYR